MNPSSDLVNALWRLCAKLRKDGVTYFQYVTELTYLLFLKMAAEKGLEEGRLPRGRRWADLKAAEGAPLLELYKDVLRELGRTGGPANRAVQAIFTNAATVIRTPAALALLIAEIDRLKWFSHDRDSFGDLYEGLLQKNAEETKRGSGQYFTPRVLIETLVDLMQPQPGEVIQDPAAGTGGFLIAADRRMRSATDDYFDLGDRSDAQIRTKLQAMENVQDVYRLLLMNLYLHGIDSERILLGDTLSDDHAGLQPADLILTNPPFGPAGGKPTRSDLSATAGVSSYQLPFVEHCVRSLKPGGRAAVIVPDNVLFEDGKGRALRRMLMERCDLHTLLRLPTGIFYAQGVKTNVLFFRKLEDGEAETEAVWIYDLRADMPAFGKTAPLKREHFDGFVASYGRSPDGLSPRRDEGPTGRFRRFTREEIAARSDNLDITWLRDTSANPEDGLSDPADLAAAVAIHLRTALAEIEALAEELQAAAELEQAA